MIKKVLAVGGASAALLLGGYGVSSVVNDGSVRTVEAPLSVGTSEDAIEGEVIVVYKDNVNPTEAADVAESISATDTSNLDEGSVTGPTTELVTLPEGTTNAEAIIELSSNPNVESVEPNYVVKSAVMSNDTDYLAGNLWGMYGDTTTPSGNPYGSQAGEVWEAGDTGSSSVVIGVIDEGIQFTHPDLANNIWTNPADPIDAVDNDGNGYVDDIHGWDFENNDNSIYDGLFDDHGTHVAGTIGAEGGNGQGVAGVNWDVSIINGRFLGSGGSGTLADAISAINYMTDLKANHGVNIVATSNSWGCYCFSVALQNAIIAGGDEDILFVAAAGNDGLDNDVALHYPSSFTCPAVSVPSGAYDCIISVAAIDDTGGLAGFSNYGDTTVDIGAPGVLIDSTVPTSSYSYYSGTSMATPHVTGAIALISSVTPALSASALKSAVLSNAATTASLVNTVTGGRLDLSFLAGLPTPPPTGSVTVCHATETTADMGNGHTGLFLSFNKEFVDRGTAGEALHASHKYDYMWLSTGSAAPCPTPGNGLGDGGFVSFVN